MTPAVTFRPRHQCILRVCCGLDLYRLLVFSFRAQTNCTTESITHALAIDLDNTTEISHGFFVIRMRKMLSARARGPVKYSSNEIFHALIQVRLMVVRLINFINSRTAYIFHRFHDNTSSMSHLKRDTQTKQWHIHGGQLPRKRASKISLNVSENKR